MRSSFEGITTTPVSAAGKIQSSVWSGGVLLLGDQASDLSDRVEVLDAGLVGLDGDAEAFLEEDDQLERADRVEDAAGDQGGLVGQGLGNLAGCGPDDLLSGSRSDTRRQSSQPTGTPTDWPDSSYLVELQGQSHGRATKSARTGFRCM